MKKNIYVMTHKIAGMNFPKMYIPLLVGSYNKDSKGILRDDTGDNISNKNENYCELTGLYWIWKNSDSDIIGLCHYRRFLSKNFLTNNSKYFLNERDIDKIFEKYNLILPKKFYYKNSVRDNIRIAPNKEDMRVLRKVIESLTPEYLDSFDQYLNRQYTYFCNIMITKKEILDEYCEWLFKILYKTEEVLDPSTYLNDNYRKRMFGFLSERLLNIWIIKNKDKLKIREVPMVNLQESFIKKIKHTLCQMRNKIFFKLRFYK